MQLRTPTRTRIWLAAGAAVIFLAAFLLLFGAKIGNSPAVEVETAERRPVPMIVDLPARTEAASTVEVRANVEGRLTEMSFLEGNMVQKGQVLFRIDPRRSVAALEMARAAVEKAEAELEMAREQQRLVNAQSALRQAEANLARSTLDLERAKPLAARRAIPERDLDAAVAAQSWAQAAVEDARATVRTTSVAGRIGLRQAEANLTTARATLRNAELDLEETVVRAPLRGLIGRAEVSVGNYVTRGDSSRLATISPLDPINVFFSISETLYLRTFATVDQEALKHIELILADNSTYPFQGRYRNLARAVDAKTGTLVVQSQFPNPKGILLPGMSGRVRVPMGTVPDLVLVSEKAVFDAQGSKAVYIVAPEKRVVLRNVVIEGNYQGKSIVTQGLSGGETVIVDGRNLSPGQTVTVRPRPQPNGTAKP